MKTRLINELDRFGIGLVLAGLVIIFALWAPADTFLTVDNVRSIFLDASELLIISAGMTFLLVSAGLDLSVGSVVVFSAVASAKVMVALAGTETQVESGVYPHLALAITVGIIVAVASGLAWGTFNGIVVVKLGIPPFIATLGTMGIALGAAQILSNGISVANVPIPLQNTYGLGRLGGVVPWPVVTAVVVVVVLGLVLSVTRFGLHTKAIGSNTEAARRSGIHVNGHQISLYVLMGGLAGLAAVTDISRFGTASIDAHTQDVLAAISAVVIGGTSLFGGRGSMWGTVIGVFIPATLLNGFIIVGIDPFWQNVAVGFVLIAAVYVDQLRRKRAQRA